MLKKYVAGLTALQFLVVTTASAQVPSASVSTTIPAVIPIPPGKDVIEPIAKGKPAPFDGQIFDNDTALRWANYLEQYKLRLKIDNLYQLKVCEITTKYNDDVLKIEKDKYTTVVTDLEKRLAKAEKERDNPPFYNTPWFGIGLGVVGTLAIIGLAAYGLNAVK